MTLSSSTFCWIVVFTAVVTTACGKSSGAGGDETHFARCTTDVDCRNSGSPYACLEGFCRATPGSGGAGSDASESSSSSAAGAPPSAAAGGSGTGGERPGTGGSAAGGSGTGGSAAGGSGTGGSAAGGAPPQRRDAGSTADASGVDASDRDGGSPEGGIRTPITPDEVGCGTIPACQSPTIKCCSATFSPGGGGCAPTTGVCSSNISLECDGPEDCSTGVCAGEPYGGGVMTQCLSTPGTYRMCHDHTQCPVSAPNCCPLYTDQFTPRLGECDTRAVLTSGVCDTP